MGWRELAAGLRAILEGQPALRRFEAELKSHFGAKHCFLVGSGKAALTLILRALKDLSPACEEVIIPAFTCYSVPSSVLRAGLKIGLCDLARDSLELDPAGLSAALSERALAVVPTHLYAIASDVPRIRRLIGTRGVAIVEDAAQAMDESLDGRKLGTLGDAGFFSLGRGKALCTVEGGVILTDRDDIANALRAKLDEVPEYGTGAVLALIAKAVALATLIQPLLFWIPRALTFLRLGETLFEKDFSIRRMSPFQAGLARGWERRLRMMRETRQANAMQWLEVLKDVGEPDSGLVRAPCPGLVRFPARIRDGDRRNNLLHASDRLGAGIAPSYPRSINRLDELRDEIRAQDCPAAERCARELVTLPTHGYVAKCDVAAIRGLLAPVSAAPPDGAPTGATPL
jgi:perosamine synthetase